MRDFRPAPGTAVIVSGLAGALAERLSPGSVIVPEFVALPSGPEIPCDPQLVGALSEAAYRLGFKPSGAPLLTAPGIVTEERRAEAAFRFEAVDMESALLAKDGVRFGVVRVILDAPGHEISTAWVRPGQALLRPWLWPQAVRLATSAPRYALRAARIAVGAYALLSDP